jgi:hypothetical protein
LDGVPSPGTFRLSSTNAKAQFKENGRLLMISIEFQQHRSIPVVQLAD